MISTRRPAASHTSRLLVKMIITCASTFLLMQTAVTSQGQESVPRRGLYSTGTYDLSGLEAINTTNGNLLLNIPLASLPPGRGGNPGFALRLHYNSKLYNAFIEQEVQPNGSIFKLRMLEPNQDEDEGGWRYNLRYELNEETLDPNCNTTSGRDIWKLRMTFPDGSAHEFRPLGYNDSLHNGFFPIRHDGAQPCGAPTVAGPRTYYSADGSYLRLVFPNDGVNPWTLYFPDGSRLVGGINLQGGPQRLQDRNGNFIDVLYATLANGHNADKVVDSLGRSIVVEHDVATRQDYITTAGFGEELKWTVKWGATYVNKTYDALFGCSHSTPKILRFGHSVVEQITLPVQANALTFKFEYNGKTTPLAPPPDPIESPGWGELSAMTLPSGAKIKYHYFHDDGEQPPAVGAPCWRQVLKNYPLRKELVYRDENDRGYNSGAPASSAPCDPATESCVTETWNYNMGQTFATTRTLTTITDPAGGFTKEFYFDSDGGSDYYPANSWLSGLVYRIENPDGTVIERDWQPNTPSGNGSAQMNPYVKFEYTSVPNSSQTTLVKTAGKEFSYDKNGNVTQLKEYDWVNYGSNPTVSGSLLRQTVNEYYNPTPDATNVNFTPNSYHAATWLYVWRAVYSSEVRSGRGQPLTRTEYSYDNPTVTANLTGEASWDSTKSGYSNPLCTNASLCTVNVVSVSHQYDGYGNRTLSIDARGYQTKLIYGSVGGFTDLYPTTLIRAFGTGIQRSTSLQYDFNTGLVTRTTDTDNNVSNETDYNALGRAVEIRAAANVPEAKTTTRIEYSDVSRYVITRSDLNSAYDGKLVSIQHFDQLGRTRLARQLEDAATQNAADETSGIKVQTRYLFSGSNSYQLVSNPYRAALSSAAGSETSMGWARSKNDSGGRLVEVQTFGGAALPAPWGSNSTSTGTVTTAYNAEFTTVTDQSLKVRRSMIDGLGRLIRMDEPDATSGNLDDINGNPIQSTSYSYDALDSLRQVTQGGQTRTFVYDSLKRLTSATNPESGLICYGTLNAGQCQANGYDANGNLIYKTDARGVLSTYAYDALNRNISVTYTNDPTSTPAVTRTYDGATMGIGRIWKTETSGSARTTINSFDALGRPLSKSQEFYSAGNGWSQPYTVLRDPYNLAGGVTSQTYPSGHTVAYAYDAAGRTNSFTGNLGDNGLRSYSTETTYSPLGVVAKEKFGTDTPIYNKLFYNSRGQLAEIRETTSDTGPSDTTWNRGKFINWYSLQCGAAACNATDNNGNLRKQETFIPNIDGSSTSLYQQYEYDSLNRLTEVQEHASNNALLWHQSFTYDRYGNRTIIAGGTSDGVNKQSFEVETATNRLLAPGDSALSASYPSPRKMRYDAAGNLANDNWSSYGSSTAGAITRTYDAENRMKSAYDSSGGISYYTYNADGQRVRRKTGNVETWQVYGMDGELLAEYAQNGSSNSPQKEYGYRNGQLLITAEAPTGRANFAMAANGGVATASSSLNSPPWVFTPAGANDGDRRGLNWGSGGGWNSSTATFQQWLQIDFDGNKTIDEIDVFTGQDNYAGPSEPTESMTFTQYGLTAYEVQYWNGSAWTTVSGGSISSNNKVWKKVSFAAVTTSKIRVLTNASVDGWSRMAEVEAWGPGAGASGPGAGTPPRMNVAETANGGVASSSSNFNDGGQFQFTAAGANNGNRSGSGWGQGEGWNDAPPGNTFPDWLQINFNGSKTIDEVDVFTAQDNWGSPSVPTETMTFSLWGLTGFEVQYWDSATSAWATLPGGSVSGNNKVWKKITFAAITTTKIRVLTNASTDGYSRIIELEAWTVASGSPSSNINWLVTDQLGTPRMIFDKTGTLAGVKRHDYLPFGEEIFAGTGGRTTAQGFGAADGVRQKFTQKERDIETGLDYFGYRYFTSIQGRWTSVDPMIDFERNTGEPQAWNLYQYCVNNPLARTDPDGRQDSVRLNGRYAIENELRKNGYNAQQVKVFMDEYDRAQTRAAKITLTTLAGLSFARFLPAAAEAFLSWAARNPEKVEQLGNAALQASSGNPMSIPEARAVNLGSKLEYILGNATGSVHNVERSTSMAVELSKIGLTDTTSTRALLADHLTYVAQTAEGVVQKNGNILKESLLVGPGGMVKLKSIWQETKEGLKLITVEVLTAKK